MTLPILDPRPTRSVPCGTCNACCRGDAIFMHPECGDDANLYKTVVYNGRLILDHKPNGDCIYLDRATGCTIHAIRPTVCRELDCRLLADDIKKHRLPHNAIGPSVLAAARRLKKNGVGSQAD